MSNTWNGPDHLEEPGPDWPGWDRPAAPRGMTIDQFSVLLSADKSRGTTERALAAVANERNRQRDKWGVQQHSPAEWMAILGEEFGEACREAVDVQWEHPGFSWQRLRQELVETAAVAVQIVEWLDSRPVSKELRDDV